MSEKRCKRCRKIVIEDWEEWLNKNLHQAYLQCPYCFYLEEL